MEMKSVSASVNSHWACSDVFYQCGLPKSALDRIEDMAEHYGCTPRTLPISQMVTC